jgi:dihydroorotate dehydrogenase (fumarate)
MIPDLTTRYLGLDLPHPLIAGAGPLTRSLEDLLALEAGGAAAVVLPSLFEEQIEHEEMDTHRFYEDSGEISPEADSFFPELQTYNTGKEAYLTHLESARQHLRIPVIASLNGHTHGGWVRFASLLEDHGAHAIELNIFYIPTDPDENSQAVEDRYVRIVSEVRAQVAIPLAVKIAPSFTALPYFVRRLREAGADGVVLFNRFLHPDIDLESMEIVPTLELSTPDEIRPSLRWIAILKDRVPVSLAASSGVHDVTDLVKLLLAGADVVQIVAAVLRNGPRCFSVLCDGLRSWMREMDYASVEQMKGSLSQGRLQDPSVFQRANYMRALTSFSSRFLDARSKGT